MIFICYLFCLFSVSLFGFDYIAYKQKYVDVRLGPFSSTLRHYMRIGYKAGKTSCDPVKNTDFDWRFYAQNQGISVLSQREALEHYHVIGSSQNAPICKSYKIVILAHIYNLSLLDEMLGKIKFFMRNNPHNSYRVKLTIPLGSNIKSRAACLHSEIVCDRYTPVPAGALVDDHALCNHLTGYINHYLSMLGESVEVIFCPNRGLDIGGFFVALDALIKDDRAYDYIVKIHTKTDHDWRNLSMSFMNIKINSLLATHDVIYSAKMLFDYRNAYSRPSVRHIDAILNSVGLPRKNFYYPAGTMFIAPRAFVEFYRTLNLKRFIDQFLPDGVPIPKDGAMEHAFERLFGYLFMHLQLRVRVIDYYPPSSVDELLQ